MNAEPVGLVLHVQAFDAITECRGYKPNLVARRANLSAATLSRLRTNDRGASPTTARALALSIGVEPAAIFPQLAGWTPPT